MEAVENGYVTIITKEIDAFLKDRARRMGVPHQELHIWIHGKTLPEGKHDIQIMLYHEQVKIDDLKVSDILSFMYSFYSSKIKNSIVTGFTDMATEKKCPINTLWLNLYYNDGLQYKAFHGKEVMDIDLVEFFSK